MASLSKILLSAQLLFTPFSGTNHTTEVKKEVGVEHPTDSRKPLLKTAAYVIASALSITAVIVCIVLMRGRHSSPANSSDKKIEANPKQNDIELFLTKHGPNVSAENIGELQQAGIDPFYVSKEQELELIKLPKGKELIAAIINFKEEYTQRDEKPVILDISPSDRERIQREMRKFEKEHLKQIFPDTQLPTNIDDILTEEDEQQKCKALEEYFSEEPERKTASFMKQSQEIRETLQKELEQKISENRLAEKMLQANMRHEFRRCEHQCLEKLFPHIRLTRKIDDILNIVDEDSKYMDLLHYYCEHQIKSCMKSTQKKSKALLHDAQGASQHAEKINKDIRAYQVELLGKLISDPKPPIHLLPAYGEEQITALREYYGPDQEDSIKKFLDASRSRHNFLCAENRRDGKSEVD